MSPPSIPIGTWWVIAAAATLLYLAVCIPVMPTRKYRIRAACFPAFGLVYLPASTVAWRHDLPTALAIHATVMFSTTLGLIGRGKDLEKSIEDERLYGRKSNTPRLTAQVLASFGVGLVLFLWLTGRLA